MKAMHKLMVTSEAYKMASSAEPALFTRNSAIDPADNFLWDFRLLRLEAEPLWDSMLSAAQNLDLTVGGKSFPLPGEEKGGPKRAPQVQAKEHGPERRGIYIQRGYHQSMDAMPNFLQAFDADDGRAPCPERTRTVTAPQSLFLMNDKIVSEAAAKFAERLRRETNGDLRASVELAYRIALGRPPSPPERDNALTYIETSPGRLPGFAWLMFNLDEFSYVR